MHPSTRTVALFHPTWAMRRCGRAGTLFVCRPVRAEARVTVLPAATDEAGPLEGDVIGLDRLVRRLVAEFPTADEQDIVAVVLETAAGYRNVRIAQYVAIFVERESREQLRKSPVPAPRVPTGDERVQR